jgi:hypothetical protein
LGQALGMAQFADTDGEIANGPVLETHVS